MRERKQQYLSGDPWLICDECGFKYRRSEMLKRWDGVMVCQKDHEHRHPQEFITAKADKIIFPDARPDTDPVYITEAVTTDDL